MTASHHKILGHVVRRGAEFFSSEENIKSLQTSAQAYENSPQEITPTQMFLLVVTAVSLLFAYAVQRYTLGEIMPTLLMIESPTKVLVVDETDKSIEEVTVIHEKPVTSSIRQTLRLLGGLRGRLRGAGIATIYFVLHNLITGLVSRVLSLLFVPQYSWSFAPIVATIILARLHMTWTHIMITDVSPVSWYRRVPKGRNYFKILLVPSAIFAVLEHLTVMLPAMVYTTLGPVPEPNQELTSAELRFELLRIAAAVATSAFVGIALLLPATVTLARIEASLLPDDVETIVPFDRSLGGSAVNAVGLGKMNLRALYDGAWRSFDRSSRIRLLFFYVKYFAIQVMIVVGFIAIITAQVLLIGKDGLGAFFEAGTAQIQLAMMDQPQ